DGAEAALADAVRLRIAVVVASGDYLANGGFLDGKAHVFYPASSPYVVSCGGTMGTINPAAGRIDDEEVWNEGPSGLGSGGGISETFPVPAYQTGFNVPRSVNPGASAGRGVPDVAALAASDPGYKIVVARTTKSRGGTSAATPLWAGVLALANAR